MNKPKEKKPVLVQIVPALGFGGVERGTVEVAKAAVAAGFRSVVISSGGELEDELKKAGAEFVYMPVHRKNPISILMNIGAISNVIMEYEADIVHARSRAPAWSAYFACKKSDAHFITTYHGTYSSKIPGKKLYNSVMAKGEKVIAISGFIERLIKKEYNIPAERIRMIHRGVDLDYFDPDKVTDAQVSEMRKNWGLPEGVPVVLMPGARLSRWKGHLVLLASLTRISHRNFRCVILGKDGRHKGYLKEIEQRIDSYRLYENVVILPPTTDMRTAYKLADVVVIPSTEPEAFGRVAVEAQAMGKPVVASDIGGTRETIIHGETGRLVSVYTSKDMGAAIERGTSLGPEERVKLAAKTRAHVRDKFSKEKMCEQTIALYREVLGIAQPEAPAAEAPADAGLMAELNIPELGTLGKSTEPAKAANE